MAEKKGFFRDPAPDLMTGFKEGNIEVLESAFKVVHPDTPIGGTDPGAHPALVWKVKRLDEDLDPILNSETDEPLIEELAFSIGNKILSKVHPGKANGPDDKDVEDAGTADDTEGPTLFFVDTVQIHAKSGARVLFASLEDGLKDDQGKPFFTGAGVNVKYVDRIWAPDWVGCIFHMKGFADARFLEMESRKDASKKYPVPYKIVDKVHRGPGEKGKGKTAAGGKTTAAGEKAAGKTASEKSGGEDTEVLTIAKKVLNQLSEKQSGQTLTFKLFWKAATDILQGIDKLDPKLLVPVTQFLKNEEWMAENLKSFDMTVDVEGRKVAIG